MQVNEEKVWGINNNCLQRTCEKLCKYNNMGQESDSLKLLAALHNHESAFYLMPV